MSKYGIISSFGMNLGHQTGFEIPILLAKGVNFIKFIHQILYFFEICLLPTV